MIKEKNPGGKALGNGGATLRWVIFVIMSFAENKLFTIALYRAMIILGIINYSGRCCNLNIFASYRSA